ncbi:uncharacterized protein LOC144468053 [Augochlora pura]
MYRFALLVFIALIANSRVQGIRLPPKVVIVGAGASGIAAATKLLQNNFDVLILEAEDRIGGRVKTIKFADYLIDHGAQCIYGHKDNVAYDLAAPLNLTDHSDPFKFEMFTSNGEQLDPDLVENVTMTLIQYLDAQPDDIVNNCNASFGECMRDRVKEGLAQFPELNNTMQEQLLWNMNLMLTGNEPADDWNDVAMQWHGNVTEGDRFVNWKLRGYSTIFDIMMKKIPNPEEELPVMNKTILNAEVTKVDYSSEDGKIKLTTQDGKEYTADHVIMTPSLGVLKADHETLFTPQLPETKTKTIKALGFGNACKVYVAFKDDWYNKEGLKNKVLQLTWSQEELEEYKKDPKKMWMPYAFGFSIVEYKPRLLMLWVSGKGSRLLEERPDEEVLEQVTEILNNFFSKTYNVSAPVAMTRSKWHQNKHFRGVYSYTSVETAKANVRNDDLAEPIMKNGKPIILFAGEATSDDNAGTVNGAMVTGWREADRLINLVQALTGSPKVVVVGAGPSGIAAATKLLQNGIEDVLILEAEDRIGGRVKTIKFDEYWVDEGAQWIHGDQGNVAYDMAAPLNLTDHSDPYKFEIFASNGEQIDPDLADNITNTMIEYLESTPHESMKTCNASYPDCVKDIFLERLAQFPELNETMRNQLLWNMNLMLTSLDPADDWTEVPMQGYGVDAGGDRGVNWKSRGYSTILDIMMKKIPNPEEELPVMNKTILNAEVTKVDYSSEDGKIKLTTQDGKEYTADHVIMTPSLGVLKADHETLFTPQLPETKTKAIKTLGFGNACKVYVAFNDNWYNKEGLKNKFMQLTWTKEELEEYKKDPKKMWMPYSMSFSVVEHKPRLLLLWISAKGGRLIDERTDEEVLEQVTEILNNFFSKTYNVSAPVAMTRSKWHQNKHFRGTYSYISVESFNANVGNKDLAEPIMKDGKPVVLFAGEATTADNVATVHGAIGSGWREAERLINLYSKTESTTEKKSE